MTVETQTSSVTVSGNGSATSFSFSDLVIFASDEVLCTHVTTAGVETVLVETTDYTVVVSSYPGTGTITFPAGGSAYSTLATGEKIIIKRVLTLEQTTDLENQGGYFPDVQETAFDKAAMVDIQQQEVIDRSLKRAISDTTMTNLELPTPVANAYLLFNTDATGLTSTSGAATQFLGGNGSAAAPFYTFASDVNSGFYRIGADNIGLSLGGTKRIDFATAGTSITGTLTTSGVVSVDDTTESTSGTSGSIHTDGGIGIAKKLHVIGTTTHGGDVLSDTDSTDSLGSTGVRWLKLWVDSIQTTANTDIAGDLTVTGNLTVNGTTVTNDATNTEIKDPLIELNSGASSNANDLGLLMERGSTGNNAFLGWDESGDYFVAATTTATADSTGNITYAYAPFKCSAITATSGTLAGITSLGLNAGATITDGILDEDAMGSNSAVALATQQSIKAYVDATAKAPGLQMTWETTTTDTDQGVGKVWANNATLSSATVLYFDDVERNSVSINALIDSLDDPTADNSATIYIQEASSSAAGVVFKVSGAVTSASTYSKVAVTHQATFGTLSDGDIVGVTIAFSGDDGGGMSNVVEDSSPQLGADLDCNGAQIQWSKGADVASNSALPVLTDGNYFDVTGTTTVTSINTTGGAGTLIKLHFDGAVTLTHHSSNLIIAGAANFTTEAGDEVEFVEYDTGKYRMTGWSLAGTAPGGGGGGAFLGEGASGASVGNSGDIIRVNQQTLDTSQSMSATDNGSCTGPFAIASGVTLTLASGSTFKVL
jgi:hypothetical protein